MAIESVENEFGENVWEGGGYTVESGMEALLNRWGVKEDEEGGESLPEKSPDTDEGDHGKEEVPPKEDKSQKAEEGDTTEEDEEGVDGEEGDEESEGEEDSESDESGEDKEPSDVDDSAKVAVKVNGESKEFTVGELKRLAGQEAALTQKSQEVSEYRKKYEEGLKVQRAALETMVERAAKRFEPFKDFDFAMAAQKYDAETYQALKEEARAAYADLNFYRTELGEHLRKQDEEAQARFREEAQKALKVLEDPDKGIPNFSREVYRRLRDYAMGLGIDEEMIDATVHPAAWIMIYKAREYDRLREAKEKAVDGKKPVKSKKVVKTTKTTPSRKVSVAKEKAVKLREIAEMRGLDSIEAAADLIAQRWQT
jgi:hypothetical protein